MTFVQHPAQRSDSDSANGKDAQSKLTSSNALSSQ